MSEFCPGDTFNEPSLHHTYDITHGYNDKNIYNLMKFHKGIRNVGSIPFINDDDLSQKRCQNYIRNEYARIKIRVDRSSYLKRHQSLKHGDADKFAIIGGTLGLFTGFSFIVIFELIYWIIVTIKKVIVFLTNNKSTNPTVNDQQPSLEEKLTKEISMLQERILKLENRKSERKPEPKPKEMQNSQLKNEMVIVDMQESFEPTENVQQ